MAPPFHLVAHFFLGATFFYALVSAILPFFYTQLGTFVVSLKLAAISHLFLLGFVMMVIFGAMYQLVPVILEIPLFSKDFAYIQFYLLFFGTALMGAAFFEEQLLVLLPYGSLLVLLAMLIFAANIFLTYRQITEWTLVAKYLFISNIFLLAAVLIGFFIALNLFYGFWSGDIMNLVSAHVAGTLGGYVLMSIMGTSLVLVPMFALSHGFNETPIRIALYLISGGVGLFMGAALLDFAPGRYAGLVLIGAAIGLYLYQMVLIYKIRARKQHDVWSKSIIGGFAYLVLAIVAMVAGRIYEVATLDLFAGFSLFFGFFAFLINGHFYKILPFLVWFQKYSPLVGKQKVPMLHEMVHAKASNWQFLATNIGTALASLGILMNLGFLFALGGIIMFVGAMLLVYNLYYILVFRYE